MAKLQQSRKRDAVAAVEQVFGHEREKLHEGHAGVAVVEVIPFRGVDRDTNDGLAHEFFEAPVVKLGYL